MALLDQLLRKLGRQNGVAQTLPTSSKFRRLAVPIQYTGLRLIRSVIAASLGGDLEKLRSYSLVDFDGKIDPDEPETAPIPAEPIL